MPHANVSARPRFSIPPLLSALSLCLGPLAVSAQTPAAPEAENVSQLETVHISASGLQTDSTEMTQPVSVIDERTLTHQSRSSLGETLEK